jgi:PAS domain S-box-containing protein
MSNPRVPAPGDSPRRTHDGAPRASRATVAARPREETASIRSEHEAADRALRESEERFRTLVESANDAIFIWDAEGRCLEANRAACERLGYSRAELLTMTAADVSAPEQAQLVTERMAEIVAHGSAFVETVHWARDGTRIPVEVSTTVTSLGGRPVFLSIARDITKRKHAEAEAAVAEARLVEQTALLQSVLDSSEAAVFAVDRETMWALYGVEIEPGRSLLDYEHASGDDVGAKRNLDRALAGERFTDEGLSGDDERTRAWFEVTHAPVRDRAGMVVGASVFTRDTTARHRADDEIRATQTLLNQTQEMAQIGGWMYEPATRTVTWTDEVYRIHDLSRDAYEPNSATRDIAFYAPADQARIDEAFRLAVSAGQPYDIELRLVTAQGRAIWVRTSGRPEIHDGQVVRILGDIQDITERKLAEEEIRGFNAELEGRVIQRTIALEAANRELEAFSYSVSHDLRAPLRSIDAFSQILLNEYAAPLDAEGRRILGIILRNVKQMGALIDDLLAFSRVTRKELDRRHVDMAGLARSVAEELQVAQPDREIVFDIGPLADAPGDAPLLRQVWVNLLGNAVKFSLPVEAPRVEVRSDQSDGEYRYTVRDNGVGFDPTYVDKLFVPFSRLHPTAQFEGTGIGLAIVARIVGRHGGRVWADGTPGNGATFGFALPTRMEAA